jgi:UDP-N-acetylmuramate dehydrogenase
MVLDRTARRWLTDTFADDVRFEEPLSKHTSFQVGGPAEALVRPKRKDDLVRLVQWAAEHGIAYMPLGAGSNILVRENGIEGLVIMLENCLASIVGNDPTSAGLRITAGAGVKLAGLCAYAIKNGLKGLNFALGIPGSVGGSIRVNAGTGDGCMGDVVESVILLMPKGSFRRLEKAELVFSYRKLDWPADSAFEADCDPIILEAAFRLKRVDGHGLKKEAEQIMKQRNRQQPWTAKSAGCIFKNPPGERSAGQLIDMAGLKGKSIGDAEVSTRHANFIINKGRATADDVLALMDLVRSVVLQRYHILLETEVRIVG